MASPNLRASIRDVLTLASGASTPPPAADEPAGGSGGGGSSSSGARTVTTAATTAAAVTGDAAIEPHGRDHDVLRDALEQRDATIRQLHSRIATDRTALEEEVAELRMALRDQKTASREEVVTLSGSLETLRFAVAHQGLARERHDAFNRTHIADAAVHSARTASDGLRDAADSARSAMQRSCERAVEHLRGIASRAKENVAQRSASEELAEVLRLLQADHERRFALLRERTRTRVAAAVRTEIENQLAHAIPEILAERVREVLLPATIDGLRPFVDDVTGEATRGALIDSQSDAARDVAALTEQQRSVLRQMSAARDAHGALADCRRQHAELTDLFARLDRAEREAKVADATQESRLADSTFALEDRLGAAKARSAELRRDLRHERTHAGVRSYSSSATPRRGPPKQPPMVVERERQLADPVRQAAARQQHQQVAGNATSLSAEERRSRLNRQASLDPPPGLSVGRSAEPRPLLSTAGTLPVEAAHHQPPRTTSRSPPSRGSTSRERSPRGDRLFQENASANEVVEVPLDQLKKYGLLELFRRPRDNTGRLAYVEGGSRFKTSPTRPEVLHRGDGHLASAAHAVAPAAPTIMVDDVSGASPGLAVKTPDAGVPAPSPEDALPVPIPRSRSPSTSNRAHRRARTPHGNSTGLSPRHGSVRSRVGSYTESELLALRELRRFAH